MEDEYSMKNNRANAALLSGAALLIVAVAAVGMSFRAFDQIEKAAEEREHTALVIERANDLMADMIDAETGQRGFLLTGDEAFLAPYLAARDSIRDQLYLLRQLTFKSAPRKRLDAVAPMVETKLAYMSDNIELRRANKLDEALANVRSGNGMLLMDSIRAEMEGFKQIEERALALREAKFKTNMRSLFAVVVFTSLLALLLAITFAFLIYRKTGIV